MQRLYRYAALVFALSSMSTSLRAADGETVAAPVFKVGDAWVFEDVNEKGATGFGQTRLDMVIDELGGETMTVGLKRDGAPTAVEDHIMGSDWSKRRLVDGQQTITTRPFAFPMHVGQSWTVDFIDHTRRGNQLSLHVHRTYSVSGWEEVVVPAGHFHALKVVSQGVDEAMVEVPAVANSGAIASSGSATSISHAQKGGIGKLVRGTRDELYYVPEIKNYVKSVEDQYNTDNVRVARQTRSLVSFTPAH